MLYGEAKRRRNGEIVGIERGETGERDAFEAGYEGYDCAGREFVETVAEHAGLAYTCASSHHDQTLATMARPREQPLAQLPTLHTVESCNESLQSLSIQHLYSNYIRRYGLLGAQFPFLHQSFTPNLRILEQLQQAHCLHGGLSE